MKDRIIALLWKNECQGWLSGVDARELGRLIELAKKEGIIAEDGGWKS